MKPDIAAVPFRDPAMTKIHSAAGKFSPTGNSEKCSFLSEVNAKIPPLLFPLPLLGGEGKGEGIIPVIARNPPCCVVDDEAISKSTRLTCYL